MGLDWAEGDLLTVGQWRMPNRQPRGLIPNHRNESRKVDRTVLKWLITEVGNPKYANS